MEQALSTFLPSQIFIFLVIFARTGSALMTMPVFGEQFVSPMVRLLIALGISLVLVPVLSPLLPEIPQSPLGLLVLLLGEVVIGAFIGTVARILLSTLESAGMIISIKTGLAAAAIFNPALGITGSPYGALLGAIGIAMVVVTDLHHLFLLGIVSSYQIFLPGSAVPLNDMSDTMGRLVAQSFLIGLQLAAPIVIGGMVLNLAMGALSRLVPQMQIFFVSLPLQIAGGLLLFSVSIGGAMLFWLESVESIFAGLFGLR